MKSFLVAAAFLVSNGVIRAVETRDFTVRGVVRETRPAKSQLVVKHEEIPGYMDAMTMPFQVRDAKILDSVKAGDAITFQLHVTDKDHWIDGLKIVAVGAGDKEAPRPKATDITPFKPGDPLPALTDAQKAELAAITDKFKAKIAERELFLNDLIGKAIGDGRYQEVPELKTQLARETASLNEDCEAAKEKARASFA